MRDNDGGKLWHGTLEELRIRVVKAVETGNRRSKWWRRGFSRPRSCEWLAVYREGGIEALSAKPIPWWPLKLDGKAIRWIDHMVTTKNPLQLKSEFALWTPDQVHQLIRERFGVRSSEILIDRLLRKLGLSPQRPLARAYQRDTQMVETWLREQFPVVQKEDKRAEAQIFFADEANVRSDYHSGTAWPAVGKTSVVERTGARHTLNIGSAISPRGELRFMCREAKLTAAMFIEFLQSMLHHRDGPLPLIVDGHPVHRTGAVKQFIAASKGQIRLFQLRSYSPDLNADELVWAHLRGAASGKGFDHNLRLSLCTSADQVREGARRIAAALTPVPARGI